VGSPIHEKLAVAVVIELTEYPAPSRLWNLLAASGAKESRFNPHFDIIIHNFFA